MEGHVASGWETVLGLIIFAGAVYGAMRYAKYRRENRPPSTGKGGGGSPGPNTKKK